MISTGVEISSLIPFEMRSSAENLMQRLPKHIRDELQAIAVKKAGIMMDGVHRFWIQPESSIKYEQTFYKGFFGRTNENITEFYLSDDLKMCVKQHRMKYDEKGNLIDDKNDAQDDESAEAQFARTFTKYYDEIGEYFPELLRLKELLKLGFLSRIIQARYESQRDLVSRIENDPALDTYLTEIKQKIGDYPTSSSETDEKILNLISNNLCKQFFCKKSNLKPYLVDWLKYDRQQALSKYVKQSLIQQRAKLKFTIEKLQLFYDDSHDNEQTMSNESSQCSWVPAAFSSDLNMKVYGGISLNSNAAEEPGIKAQQKLKSITKEDAPKLIDKGNKLKSKKQRDKDKSNNNNNNNNNNNKGKSLCFCYTENLYF
jgi:hypothetical protein